MGHRCPGDYPSDHFASNGGATVVFEFTLDSTYTVDSVANWGYHNPSPNANTVSAATFDFSTDGGSSYSSSQSATFAAPSGSNTAAIFDFTAVDANYIRMTVTDNHYSSANPNAGGDRVGLTDVVFTSVPEPSSAMLLGFGVAGLLISRRRR